MSKKKSSKLLNQLERELQNLPDELFLEEEEKWKDLKKKGYFSQKNLNLSMISDIDADMFDIGIEENNSDPEKNVVIGTEEIGKPDAHNKKKKPRRGKSVFVPRGRGSSRASRGARGSIYRKFVSDRGRRGSRNIRGRFDSRLRYDEHRKELRAGHSGEREQHKFYRRQNSSSRREEFNSSVVDKNEEHVFKDCNPSDIFGMSSSVQNERLAQEMKLYSHETDFTPFNQIDVDCHRLPSPELRRVTKDCGKRIREGSVEHVTGEKRSRWDMNSLPCSSRTLMDRRSITPTSVKMDSVYDQEFIERELSPGMLARLRNLSPDSRQKFILTIKNLSKTSHSYNQNPQSNKSRSSSPDERSRYGIWNTNSLESQSHYALDTRDTTYFTRKESPAHYDKDSRSRIDSPERSRYNNSSRERSPRSRTYFEQRDPNRDKSPRMDFMTVASNFDQTLRSREFSPRMDSSVRQRNYNNEHSRDHYPNARPHFDENSRFREHLLRKDSSGVEHVVLDLEQVSSRNNIKDKNDIEDLELRGHHRGNPHGEKRYNRRVRGSRSPKQQSSLEKRYRSYRRSNSRDSTISLSSSEETSKWNRDRKTRLNEFQYHQKLDSFSQASVLQLQTSEQPSQKPEQVLSQETSINQFQQGDYIPPPGTMSVALPVGGSMFPPQTFEHFPNTNFTSNSNSIINYPTSLFPPVLGQPPPTNAQNYSLHMNWPGPNIPPPFGAPLLQGTSASKTSEESKKEAIEKEQKQQKQTLMEQREEYVRKSANLNYELEMLRVQKKDLLDEKSPENSRILSENKKLQNEIQNKIKAIANVIDMLSGIIGDKEVKTKMAASSIDNISKSSVQPQAQRKSVPNSIKFPSPPGVDNENPIITLDKPNECMYSEVKPGEVQQITSVPSTSEDKTKDVFNYIHYDPEMHWCRVCNVFPKTAKEYLNHLHSSEHKKQTVQKQLVDTPWHLTQNWEQPVQHKDAPIKRVPIRGLQFFISATAWYCKLCDIWIGDLHCASNHLKSSLHFQKYSVFVEKNPQWELNWLADRSQALESAVGDSHRLKQHESSSKQESVSKNIKSSNKKDTKLHSNTSSVNQLSEQLILALKKKNRRGSKSRKISSSSSGSITSIDSDEAKNHSIRVTMRNKNSAVSHKISEKDEIKFQIPKVKSKWDSPEKEIFRDKDKAVSDRIFKEWMEVPDKDRDMIKNLKDRLKSKQIEFDRESEKRRMDKNKHMRDSREKKRESRRDESRSNSRRDHSDRGSRSSRRSTRTPEGQKERKVSASKGNKAENLSSKVSESTAGQSSGKLEKPTGGRQIWVPGSDDSDLEGNTQTNFEKQIAESVFKKRELQTIQKPASKPKLPFIGRMPFIGKLSTTKRRSEENVEEVNKNNKPKDRTHENEKDKPSFIWPDIPKVLDSSQVSSELSLTSTTFNTVSSSLSSSFKVTLSTSTASVIQAGAAEVLKSTLLMSKAQPLNVSKKKKKNKKKQLENIGGVVDMDLDEDEDDNSGVDKQNLPKDFQDALDILFPSDNLESQPSVSDVTNNPEVSVDVNAQPTADMTAHAISSQPVLIRCHPAQVENMIIHQHSNNDISTPGVMMTGMVETQGSICPGQVGPPALMDNIINPPGPPLDGRMGPPGPIEGRIGHPVFMDNRIGPMEGGRIGPPGPVNIDEGMQLPGLMLGPGPRMGPPVPMEERIGPCGPMNDRIGPPGGIMRPPGPIGGIMRMPGPMGPMGVGMRPLGPMGPPSIIGNRMRPPGPMDEGMDGFIMGSQMNYDNTKYESEGTMISEVPFKKKNPPSQKKRLQMKKRKDELVAKENELKKKIEEQAEKLAQKEKNKMKAELDELAMLGIETDDMAAQTI